MNYKVFLSAVVALGMSVNGTGVTTTAPQEQKGWGFSSMFGNKQEPAQNSAANQQQANQQQVNPPSAAQSAAQVQAGKAALNSVSSGNSVITTPQNNGVNKPTKASESACKGWVLSIIGNNRVKPTPYYVDNKNLFSSLAEIKAGLDAESTATTSDDLNIPEACRYTRNKYAKMFNSKSVKVDDNVAHAVREISNAMTRQAMADAKNVNKIAYEADKGAAKAKTADIVQANGASQQVNVPAHTQHQGPKTQQQQQQQQVQGNGASQQVSVPAHPQHQGQKQQPIVPAQNNNQTGQKPQQNASQQVSVPAQKQTVPGL